MTDLVLHRATTPVTYQHAHQITAMPPLYGISAVADASTLLPDGYVPPPPAVLAAMREELMQALVGCTKTQAAKAAASLIAAYPQNDNTTSAYAAHLAQRLAACPPDLLDAVINRVIDESPDFRPGAGRVAQAVRREIAKRNILLQRVDSAIRWWAKQEEAERIAVEASEFRAKRAAQIVDDMDRAWRLPGTPSATPIADSTEKPLAPRPIAPLPLSGDALNAARQRVGVSAKSPKDDPGMG